MPRDRSESPSGGVQSVDRAISALEILARDGEVSVTEIATEIGVHKSTASRLLGALEERELVEQAYQRGKYRLGFGILRLATAVPAQLDLAQQGRAICVRLASEVGETVNIAALRSRYVVNIDQVRGPTAVGTHNWVGELTPLHATSSGKVLLAFMAPQRRSELLDEAGLDRYTDSTITSREELEGQLRRVAADGFVVSTGELEEGLTAVAAPIRDHAGVVIAAVSVSGPVYRLDARRATDIAHDVVAAGAAISRRMGYLA